MILVTGSTGKVGQQLVAALLKSGTRFQALARTERSARELTALGAPVVTGDLADAASLRPALRGVERLFLLSSGADPFAGEATAIAAAKAAGVRHVVKLSAMGAQADATNSFLRGHGRAERLLEDSGTAWTFLRPTFFQQNWVLYHAPAIAARQPVYSNTGTARLSWIDTRDIADVAVAALTSDAHAGRIYDLTGPEALSYAQVTEQLSRLLGRKVEHVAVGDHAAYQAMVGMGMPADYAFALTTLNQAVRRGVAEVPTGTVELVTGKAPRPLDAFLREHLGQFGG